MVHPLEPGPAEAHALGAAALSFVEQFIHDLPAAKAADTEGGLELARLFDEPAPEQGRSFDGLQRLIADAAATSLNAAGPGHLAYIPGGGLYASAIADFLTAALNRYVTMWSVAPAFAQLEATVVRWLCDLVDYPKEARGILTSGGSLANFSAIVTARHAMLPEDFLAGTIYVTTETHASVAKAAYLAGFPRSRVRAVPVTTDLRMDLVALEEMVRSDRAAGLTPFCVVASAGTTNTGAIDPMAALAAYTRSEKLWLHVDGAYGGCFQLTERGRARLTGIGLADSVTLDPHKGMFLPYGTGALVVREGWRLRDAHHVDAHYLQDLAGEERIPNFAEYSPELSRNMRGLRLWLPIQLHGLGAFRAALDEKLDLARYVYEELRATPGFEVPWEPALTVVPFRYVSSGVDPDKLNAELLRRINASQRVILSSTRVHGRFTLRVCILCHRTHADRVEEAVDIIRTAAASL